MSFEICNEDLLLATSLTARNRSFCGRHEMPPVILSENERTELSNGSQFNVDGTKLKAEARLIVRIRMTI